MGYKDAELVFKAAIDLEGIQTSDRMVWVALAFHRNSKTGMCFPAIETLMAETGLSRQGVKNCVHHLEELGVLKIIPGGGRKSNRYNLLIHHVDKDDMQLFPVEDLDVTETTTRLVSSPQQASELPSAVNSVAPCRLVSSPESGSLTPEVETRKLNPVTVNGSAGIGQRVTGSSSHNTNTTGETPVPPSSNDKDNDNDQDSGEQSPDPSVTKEVPFEKKVGYLVEVWKEHTTKKFYESDFRWLVENSGDDWLLIDLHMSWMFERSDFWAMESPAWETGPKAFDIANSRAFRTNYFKIRDSRNSFYEQVAATIARRKQKQVDDSGMTETINALRDNVERQKTDIVDGLEEDSFHDDDFLAISVRLPEDVEKLW